MIGQTNERIRSNGLQQALRKNTTDAEQALWRILRGRQIAGIKFRRQHPFGDYILDFVCLENRLVIEVDGGQHAEQVTYDQARTKQLQKAGFHVLRFWNNEVLREIEAVKESIWLTVRELQPHPHPSLPLEGEGTLNQIPPSPPLLKGGKGSQNQIPLNPPFSKGDF